MYIQSRLTDAVTKTFPVHCRWTALILCAAVGKHLRLNLRKPVHNNQYRDPYQSPHQRHQHHSQRKPHDHGKKHKASHKHFSHLIERNIGWPLHQTRNEFHSIPRKSRSRKAAHHSDQTEVGISLNPLAHYIGSNSLRPATVHEPPHDPNLPINRRNNPSPADEWPFLVICSRPSSILSVSSARPSPILFRPTTTWWPALV